MIGSVTMVGFGSTPTEGWEIQTIEQRIQHLDELGRSPDDQQRAALLGKVGLAEFRITQQSASTVAIAAAKAAIADAYERCPGFDVSQIGLFISGGSSIARAYPATACLIQEAVGVAEGAAEAFDVLAACNSLGQALHTARATMRQYGIPFAVVAFGEPIFSKVANRNGPQDAHWCLWGDGGGAIVLRYDPKGSPKVGLVYSRSVSFGKSAHLTCSRGLGTDALPGEPWNPSMEGLAPDIQRFVREHMPPFIQQCLERSGLERTLDHYLPHAANRHAGRKIGKDIGVAEANVLSEIEKYGNTSSASCAITLDHAVRSGRFTPGSLTAINPFGGGMVASCVLNVWPD